MADAKFECVIIAPLGVCSASNLLAEVVRTNDDQTYPRATTREHNVEQVFRPRSWQLLLMKHFTL